MAENNKIGKEQYFAHLDHMIFGNEMLFLSEPIVKRLIFMVKKLKKILLLGYMENNKIENEGRMKNGQQGIVCIWID